MRDRTQDMNESPQGAAPTTSGESGALTQAQPTPAAPAIPTAQVPPRESPNAEAYPDFDSLLAANAPAEVRPTQPSSAPTFGAEAIAQGTDAGYADMDAFLKAHEPAVGGATRTPVGVIATTHPVVDPQTQRILSRTTAGRILDAFTTPIAAATAVRGAETRQEMATPLGLSAESEKWLRDVGVFKK